MVVLHKFGYIGTYYPDEGEGQNNNDREASFTMKNDLALYGGFNGTETSVGQRNLALNKNFILWRH